MIRFAAALLLAQAALFTTSTSAAQQSESIIQTVDEHDNVRGEIDKRPTDFVHRSSGYLFPAQLAEMPARKTITYGERDAGVYYTLYGGGNGDAWIDLIVYPVTQEISAEVSEVESLIVENAKATKIEPLAELPSGVPGLQQGWFEGTVGKIPAFTGYRLARRDNWYLKVRVTIPREGGAESIDRAINSLAAIQWVVPDLVLKADGLVAVTK